MKKAVLLKLLLALVSASVVSSVFLQFVLWSLHSLWAPDVGGKSMEDALQSMSAPSRFVVPILCALALALVAYLLGRFIEKFIAGSVLCVLGVVAGYSVLTSNRITSVSEVHVALLYLALFLSYSIGHILAFVRSR
jgi:hypothetical protein